MLKIVVLITLCVTTMVFPDKIYAEQALKLENEKLDFLSYEEAVKLAIKESTEIKNLKLDKESKSIKLDDTLDDFGDSLYNPQLLALMKLQKSDNLSSESAEKTENFINQYLKTTIKTTFNNINLMQEDIKLKKEQLQNSESKWNTLKLKVEYGMESKTNLKTAELQIAQDKKDIEKLEKDLEDQYINLNRLLGLDIFARYEIEKIDFDFLPIKDTQEDIEFKITRTINSDLTLWGKKQQMEIQSLDIDFYALNYIDGASSKMQTSPTPYKALKLDIEIASNDIEKAKEDIRNSVISKYNSIKKLEDAHENTLLKIKELEEKKRILEVAIKAGTTTDQDYKDLLIGIKQANYGLETIESQHNLLVEIYNNPLLAGSSLN
ncbi:TolC family protein [Acetoanaerobium noterae]|uniref:TolC family protein n=1 Tax=Acetoanaerobium noterae TaxID=745369 RepID=UPI0028B1229C|nr:TolC family protein [Acetoanaerobium noterae]